ncbi:MAG: molybdenum cofactor biosynthesis protein MoaE [Planctomycetota bacterium]
MSSASHSDGSVQVLVEIHDQPLESLALADRLASPHAGAQLWFHGVTRRTTKVPSNAVSDAEGGDAEGSDPSVKLTDQLAYEAHRPMAIKQLTALAKQAAETYDLLAVVVVHRLGIIPIGEASVIVGVSAAHRLRTFEAVAWIMERLKQDVPIWKQEQYATGQSEWIHPIVEAADESGRP